MFSTWLHRFVRHLSVRNATSRTRKATRGKARLRLEALEDRAVPATYLVNSTADVIQAGDDQLTLREALTAAVTNAISGDAPAGDVGLDTIQFAIGTTGSVQTIKLNSTLPDVRDTVVFDGFSQGGPGYTGPPLIELDGSGAGAGVNGLTLTSADNVVRGLVINRFGGHGIQISGVSATGNIIQGNYIGTGINGSTDLGNTGDGVRITLGSDNLIGTGNVIAFNAVGVNVLSGVGNTITSNSIFSNDALGIDLGNDGVTDNDLGDADSGANDLQNYPLLTDACLVDVNPLDDDIQLVIHGTLNSIAETTFTLEFFAEDPGDPSGFGEGRIFLGSYDVTTDDSGNVDFTTNPFDFPPTGFIPTATTFLTATATRQMTGDTSEFSLGLNLFDALFVVRNTNDDGLDSLRKAITNANLLDGLNTITFDIPAMGAQTIDLLSPLDDIIDEVSIDGTSQPGFVDTPLVILDGGSAGMDADGLTLAVGGNTIRGLQIQGFTGSGIVIMSANNVIGGTLAGQGNVISDNAQHGVRITGVDAWGNLIAGNKIGTDAAGNVDLGNGLDGISLDGAGTVVDAANVIGGDTSAEANVISGNEQNGIQISALSAPVVIQGNFIGTNFDGTDDLGNGGDGVRANFLVSAVTIGGASAATRNVISGNQGDGIEFNNSGVLNVVQGNFIGTNFNGTADLGNGGAGVRVVSIGTVLIGTNRDGMSDDLEGNVISGNSGDGVFLSGGSHVVAGNRIGTDVTGMVAIGNDVNGISITAVASIIGGDIADERNLISGNARHGIEVTAGASGTSINGNFIGTRADGGAALPNGTDGINVNSGATNTLIGINAPNVISGNGDDGIEVTGSTTTGTSAQNNQIGVTADGTTDLLNGDLAVALTDDATLFLTSSTNGDLRGDVNTDGTLDPGAALADVGVIDITGDYDQTADGILNVEILGSDPTVPEFDQLIVSDTVTLAGTLNVTLPTGFNPAAQQFVIITAGAISGTFDTVNLPKTANGTPLFTISYTPTQVILRGNLVVNSTADPTGDAAQTTLSEAIDLANDNDGLDLILFDIPTSDPGYDPVAGIWTILVASELPPITDEVIIDGTSQPGYAGTPVIEIDGSATLSRSGLVIANGKLPLVGSSIVALSIYSFDLAGVAITGDTHNSITASYLGLRADGSAAGNGGGVFIATADNTIGGGTAAARNVISANSGHGIQISSVSATGNIIQGNYIGTGMDGSTDLGNTGDGVRITLGSGNLIGTGNVIAFNAVGVNVLSGVGNTITSNSIFSNDALGIDLGNDGVTLNDAGDVDGGANNLQTFPVLTDACLVDVNPMDDDIQLVIHGTLNSIAETTFTLEFFAEDPGDPSGFGEGRVFLGSYDVTTDDMGNVAFTTAPFDFPPTGFTPTATTFLTATATRQMTDDTSEFSPGLNLFDALFVVRNTNDAGLDSLRKAISNANLLDGRNEITFDIPAPGVQTISLLTALPDIIDEVSIDGTTQPGYAGTPLIEINGGGMIAHGLVIADGNDPTLGSSIVALSIFSFAGDGIRITGDNLTSVTSSYLGLRANGSAAGNGGHGIFIATADNTIGGATATARNVISANSGHGVQINGTAATGNTVEGNYIGTNVAGTADLGNRFSGVRIVNAASTTIRSNLISGNDQHGVEISGADATDNVVASNLIGTDVTGEIDLGNRFDGVNINSSAFENTIGGATMADRNIISGNDRDGVRLDNAGTMNRIAGNSIGTDDDGDTDLGNNFNGVIILNTAEAVVRDNVISGNDQHGVQISGLAATGNVIAGNLIGTDVTGEIDLGNAFDGVHINRSASDNTIGGTTLAERNVISSNDRDGVRLDRAGTMNRIVGNFIGTDDNGASDLGNTFNGVIIIDTANTSVRSNVISGNDQYGVQISGLAATGNVVVGNFIGTDVTGEIDLGNRFDGVNINSSAFENTIGGATMADRNIISGNDRDGVRLDNAGTMNRIAGNSIGTDDDGDTDLGNNFNGVIILNTAEAVVRDNVISGNDQHGVEVSGSDSTLNTVAGNLIGIDVTGEFDLGNTLDGVNVNTTAGNNTIGGMTVADRNVISGNNRDGVRLDNAGTTNLVQGNFIGTDDDGDSDLGNTFNGILIVNTANTSVRSNVISGNDQHGVQISGLAATGNVIAGNLIGTDVTGEIDLGNAFDGVHINRSASDNTIGGTTLAERNVISSNDRDGVRLDRAGTMNRIVGNSIGTDDDGDTDLGNNFNGVNIVNTASTTVRDNVISGNDQHGVEVGGSDSTLNTVAGNLIGIDVTGEFDLGNTLDGVNVNTTAGNNTIGGMTVADRNVISGNNRDGVRLDNAGTMNLVQGNFIGTDDDGMTSLPNLGDGVLVLNTASATIGGTVAAAGNLIAGNAQNGIEVNGPLAVNTLIQNNRIGTNGLGNQGNGVQLTADSRITSISANMISNNALDGVDISGGAANNSITGNTINGNTAQGVEISGAGGNNVGTNNIFANGQNGVLITASTQNIVSGNTAINNNGQNGVSISQAMNNEVRGNTVMSNVGNGIAVADSSMIVIAGNTADSNGQNGVLLSRSSNNEVSGNTLNSNVQNGVEINSAGFVNNVVASNGISGNGGHGIEISDTTSNDVVGNNILGNALHGVFIRASSQNEVSNNTSNNNGQSGVALEAVTMTTVAGNTSHGNGQKGVSLFGSSNIEVRGNNLNDNHQEGLELTGSATTNNLVIANSISGNRSRGVVLSGGTSGNDLNGNNIFSNTLDGVFLVGASANRIVGNSINANLQKGVYLVNSLENEVRANSITANQSDGVELNGNNSARNSLMGNAIGGNTLRGVVLSGGASDNDIGTMTPGDSNNISNNGTDGVFLVDVSMNRIVGNTINSNPRNGALLARSPNNELSNNSLSNNFRNGVEITGVGANSNIISNNVISANQENGVDINNDATNNWIRGNLIQLNTDGVYLESSNNVIGNPITTAEFNPDAGFFLPEPNSNGNVIRDNRGNGVAVGAGRGNVIRHNTIINSGGLEIDLGRDGFTPNDPGDNDDGANRLQNFPTLVRVSTFQSFTTLRGTFSGRPNTNYVLDLYSSANFTPGQPQAEVFHGQVAIRTNALGTADLTRVLRTPIDNGRSVTITATDEAGNTSELSVAILVAPNQSFVTEPLALFAAGTGPGVRGDVKIYSASTGEDLTTLQPFGGFGGGIQVATGDVNGDGVQDVVVAAGPGGGTHVKVFDGSTLLTERRELFSFFAFPGFGGAVFISVGDVNGDGAGDIIVGAGAGGLSHVKVFSGGPAGSIPTELLSFYAFPNPAGPASNFSGDIHVGAADFNADGRADILIGAGPGAPPHVKIIGLVRPGVLIEMFSQVIFAPTFLGGVLVHGGNVDGDAFPEVVVSSGGPGTQLAIIQAVNGVVTPLSPLTPPLYPGFGGGLLTTLADGNSDGILELVTVPDAGPADFRVFNILLDNGFNLALLSGFVDPEIDPRVGVFIG